MCNCACAMREPKKGQQKVPTLYFKDDRVLPTELKMTEWKTVKRKDE